MESVKAIIITIGDELLIGQVIDTNSAYMATCLNRYGVEVLEDISVHDDALQIAEAVHYAMGKAPIVLLTGGLGPTKDDITKRVLCGYFRTTLVPDETVRAHIYDIYKERPDVLNRLTETQWLVPANATILPNRVGSAPLMVWLQDGHCLVSMPGVPYEMQIAMDEQIMPFLSTHILPKEVEQITHRTVLVHGIPESALAIRIEDWETSLPPAMHLAYLPKDGLIRLRLSGYGVAPEAVDAQIHTLLPLIQDYVLATEDKPIEVLVGEALKHNNRTIATAESCTGGRLAALLNAHPGSSAFYYGSVVAYDNSVKHNVLGVPSEDLQQYGAVSEPVVRQMAEGVRSLLHTDYAIATSGIAGPDGGTPEKPVGTVWMAWATPHGTYAQCFHLGKLREQITLRACNTALIYMLSHIMPSDMNGQIINS